MQEITIRKITSADKEQYKKVFSDVIHQSFPEYSDNIKKYIANEPEYTFDENIQNSKEYYIGAFDNDQLVGIGRATNIHAGVGVCTWILVNKSHRNQGIGTNLLHVIESALREDGIHSLHLYAPERNKEYYLSVGYTLVGLWKKAWYGVDDYLFVKQLREPKEENFLK